MTTYLKNPYVLLMAVRLLHETETECDPLTREKIIAIGRDQTWRNERCNKQMADSLFETKVARPAGKYQAGEYAIEKTTHPKDWAKALTDLIRRHGGPKFEGMEIRYEERDRHEWQEPQFEFVVRKAVDVGLPVIVGRLWHGDNRQMALKEFDAFVRGWVWGPMHRIERKY